MKNFKKFLLLFICSFCVLLSACGSKKEENSDENITIVTTTFSSYDFIKHIIDGVNNTEVICLLKPGVDSHSYSPSPKDYITINNSDLFIYVGSSVEPWITDSGILTLEDDQKYALMDLVNLEEEMEIDGAEEHEEEDEGAFAEHVWTSLDNANEIIEKLAGIIAGMDKENEAVYLENAEKYVREIAGVKQEIKEIVENADNKHLVFGDKMPMQYFINEFGLEVSAAFDGCSTETEPSVATIAYLTDVVKSEQIPVVLYIELSEGNIAKTIANETNTEALQIQTLHNISETDFNNGETYVSLMRRNIDVLKKALNRGDNHD